MKSLRPRHYIRKRPKAYENIRNFRNVRDVRKRPKIFKRGTRGANFEGGVRRGRAAASPPPRRGRRCGRRRGRRLLVGEISLSAYSDHRAVRQTAAEIH